MSDKKIQISLWSNNLDLQRVFLEKNIHNKVSFFDYQKYEKNPYVIALIDLSSEIDLVSHKIISIYEKARILNQKISITLVHTEKIDGEKNIYFQKLLSEIGKSNPLHRLVFVKDLYQMRENKPVTWLDKKIIQAILDNKINISTKGENYLYPLEILDLIEGLLKTLFLNNTSGRQFWLIGDEYTDLELAYLLKKNIDKESEVEFEISASEDNYRSLESITGLGNETKAIINWEPKTEFSESIKQIYTHVLMQPDFKVEEHLLHPKNGFQKFIQGNLLINDLRAFLNKLRKSKKKVSVENKKKKILFLWLERGLATIAFTYMLISLSFIIATGLSLIDLESSLEKIKAGDIGQSVELLQRSKKILKIGESSYSLVSPVISIVLPDLHTKNFNLFTFERYSQNSLESLQQTYVLAENFLKTINTKSDGEDIQDLTLALKSNLSQVYENLNQIELLTQSSKLPDIIDAKIQNNAEFKSLDKIKGQLSQLIKIVDLVPGVLDGDRAKNIVFLAQNTHELRSTGGVIEYIINVVIDHGKIVAYQIYSSSELDSKIAEPVLSPPIVSKITGSDVWKLQDFNYNPDFPQTSENISWFIDHALKFKPDYIIAFNDKLISQLISNSSGVTVGGNLVEKDELEKKLAGGDPTLYKELTEYFLQQFINHQIPLITLGKVISNQIGENQILVWSSDVKEEKNLSQQYYSGAIVNHACPPGLSFTFTCISETSYINESNFSLMPINNSLKRTVIHNITFDLNQIKHQYKIQYSFKNKVADFNRPLNQIYQIYLDSGSEISKILLDNKEIDLKNLQKQIGIKIDRYQFSLPLSLNQNHNIELEYTSINKTPRNQPFSYAITEFAQPGMYENSIQEVINYGANLRPASVTSEIISGPNNLTFTAIPRTSVYGVSFIQKQP